MSLRIRFRFDGRCRMHPRYNPEEDGRPQHKECPGCDSLYVIHLYTRIAGKRAESADGLVVARYEGRTRAGEVASSPGEQLPEEHNAEVEGHDANAGT